MVVSVNVELLCSLDGEWGKGKGVILKRGQRSRAAYTRLIMMHGTHNFLTDPRQQTNCSFAGISHGRKGTDLVRHLIFTPQRLS